MTARRALAALAASVLLLSLGACGSSRRPSEGVRTEPDHTSTSEPASRNPVLRVGIEEAAGGAVIVSARGGLALSALPRGNRVGANLKLDQISFFIADAGSGRSDVYRVQVASFRDKANADSLAGKIRRETGLEVAVSYSGQTRTYRVQAGKAGSREEAAEVERELRSAGYKETWVLRTSEGVGRAGTIAAVDPHGKRIAVAPAFRCSPVKRGETLSVGGTAYRGSLELMVGKDAAVLPVNIVDIEQYLRGVVPVEMSPTAFPQLEALKAQAVAARTYAYSNRGQYAADGYDICETARCQVYKGADAERELTDRAVAETAGEVATYDGEPINALFTSTCGGHTENVENIFPGDAEPYLRGVPCEPEAELFSRLDSGSVPQVTFGSDGLPLDFELAALRVAGVLPRGFRADPAQAVPGAQWRRWLAAAATRMGHGNAAAPNVDDTPTLAGAISATAEAVGWNERIDRHVSDGDLQLLSGFDGIGEVDGNDRNAILYFLRLGLVFPEPDGSLPFGEPLRQTAALRLLHRLLLLEALGGKADGRLVRAGGGEVTLSLGEKTETYRLLDGAALLKSFQEYTVPVRSLQMTPGDRVLLILDSSGGAGALVHFPSLEGIASDRSSRYFQWDVSYSPGELREKIRRYADVGEITDLRPLRLGVSERVVELEVVGTEGTSVLKGLRIRWALGLRENLFIIEKRYDEAGKIAAWRFIGKGWGHGVGLCQVGASGMAIAGAGYREILRHYYRGVDIRKLY